MRGGDISNEVPARVAVTLDCILDRSVKLTKILGISVPSEETNYSRLALAMLWRFAEKHGYILELVGYGYSQRDMDEVLDDLNNLGTNPFNYSKAYRVPADLVAELAYRPELKHVVDIPSRGLRYGHWYLDMGSIDGSR